MRDEVQQHQTDAANAASRAWGLYQVPLPGCPDAGTGEFAENDDAVLLDTFDSHAEARDAADVIVERFAAARHVAPLLDLVSGWVVDGEFIPDE